MRLSTIVGLTGLVMLPVTSRSQTSQGRDYPPFTVINGFYRTTFKETRFDHYEFPTDQAGANTRIEGHRTDITYTIKDNDSSGSSIEDMRTWISQLNSVGGELLYAAPEDQACEGDSNRPILSAKFIKNSQNVYVAFRCTNSGSLYFLTVLEEKALATPSPSNVPARSGAIPTNNLVLPASTPANVHGPTPSTEGLLDASGRPIQAPIAPTLKATGHVQVYINFVTDSAQLQSSSNPVLNELAATLKADLGLVVDLVGHTDAVGSDAHNQDLSKRRAASVYLWLVQHGIARSRLQSEGRGFLEPIATNDTPEGRALNRRVEVKTTS